MVDAVGITDSDLMETLVPLERKPSAAEGSDEARRLR